MRKKTNVVNSGYGEAGASHKKKALKGFKVTSGNAHEDIDRYNDTLRQRARMLYISAPIATSAIRTNRTNVVGIGLRLKSRINRTALGMTAKAADAWEKHTEAEFELWASKKQACDITRVNDFYALQQLTFISWLISGDCFVLIKQSEPTSLLPYGLRLHVIEADRINTPSSGSNYLSFMAEGKAENGNRIFDGVEINSDGAITAYYIRDSNTTDIPTAKTEWTRVEAYGVNTELPNILHVMDSERPEQYRGVSYLAQIIEPLLQLRRYTESELMAAVVESFFTAFIQTTAPPDTMPMNDLSSDDSERSDPNDYEMGPGVINVLKNGESVTFADPKRPSSGFQTFTRAISEQIGAGLEIPADLLLKSFNASYSASRAALLEAWKAFKMRRTWFVSDFCQPVYEIWLSEAIARGRIKAPGFFTDPAIRQAWLGSDWVGPSQGQLDPVKEITAELLAISEGISTHEQSTIKLTGGDWDANAEQLIVESEKLAAINGSSPNDTDGNPNQGISGLVREVVKNCVKETIEY